MNLITNQNPIYSYSKIVTVLLDPVVFKTIYALNSHSCICRLTVEFLESLSHCLQHPVVFACAYLFFYFIAFYTGLLQLNRVFFFSFCIGRIFVLLFSDQQPTNRFYSSDAQLFLINQNYFCRKPNGILQIFIIKNILLK